MLQFFILAFYLLNADALQSSSETLDITYTYPRTEITAETVNDLTAKRCEVNEKNNDVVEYRCRVSPYTLLETSYGPAIRDTLVATVYKYFYYKRDFEASFVEYRLCPSNENLNVVSVYPDVLYVPDKTEAFKDAISNDALKINPNSLNTYANFFVIYDCCHDCYDQKLTRDLVRYCGSNWRNSDDKDKKFLCSYSSNIHSPSNHKDKRFLGLAIFGTSVAVEYLLAGYLIWKTETSINPHADPFEFDPAIDKRNNLLAYCKYHLVQKSHEYCIKSRVKRHRPEWMENFPLASHQDIATSLRNNPRNYAIANNLPSPYQEILVRDVVTSNNDRITIPVYLRARLTHAHVPLPNSRPTIPSCVYRQMEQMGLVSRSNAASFQHYDEAGHLLAHSLGGITSETWNFVPQSMRLNHGSYSSWAATESEIKLYLEQNRNAAIDWSMIVIYDDGAPGVYRPLGFCLQYYSPMLGHEVDECFSNDPSEECKLFSRDAFTGLPLR